MIWILCTPILRHAHHTWHHSASALGRAFRHHIAIVTVGLVCVVIPAGGIGIIRGLQPGGWLGVAPEIEARAPVEVPEPPMAWVFGVGLAGLGAVRLRRVG